MNVCDREIYMYTAKIVCMSETTEITAALPYIYCYHILYFSVEGIFHWLGALHCPRMSVRFVKWFVG